MLPTAFAAPRTDPDSPNDFDLRELLSKAVELRNDSLHQVTTI